MTKLADIPAPSQAFDPQSVRMDFPILQTRMNGHPLIYLDNAATTQKPQAVIDALVHYYSHDNANIHRGVYALSQRATEAHDAARRTVARFINAPDPVECLFVRNATEGINLVALSWARSNLQTGDEILVGEMEHHSNIVPWQMTAQATGATVRVIPMNGDGELILDDLDTLLTDRTKLVAVQHVSNALGTIQDVETIVARAKKVGAKVLIDGAQWVAHHPTDVQALGCDFYAISGHKLFGPTGIGVLWGRRELLEAMPPLLGGGDMIETVRFSGTTYAPLPNKFEAGTPDIAGAIALAAAIDYLTGIGFDTFEAHEQDLLAYGLSQIGALPGVRILGKARKRAGAISFVIDQPPISAIDIGMALDRDGIAVRTGHHCCMPLMERLNVPATTRASFAFYNTREEIDRLVESLRRLIDAKTVSRARSDATTASITDPDDLPFGQPVADSPQAAADELAEDFELFEDRESRTQYVLDLGGQLPHAFDTLKQLTARVPGCMSEVYLIGRARPGHDGILEFTADSNADIVRGLIAILQRLYSGQKARAVLDFDIEGFFSRIGLDQFISSQRRNGLAGMIGRIRSAAERVAGNEDCHE